MTLHCTAQAATAREIDPERLAQAMCFRSFHVHEYHKQMEVGRVWICHFHREQARQLITAYGTQPWLAALDAAP